MSKFRLWIALNLWWIAMSLVGFAAFYDASIQDHLGGFFGWTDEVLDFIVVGIVGRLGWVSRKILKAEMAKGNG